MEKVIEIKSCKHCQTSFDITDKDKEFYEKVSPIFGGKKYLIPTPKLCPDCRQQRRYTYLNLTKLYKRPCSSTGEKIISIYSPDKLYKVYHQDYWWSDNWNPLQYGFLFNFNQYFFNQIYALDLYCPKINLINISSENSDYCALGGWNKNCYLIVGNNSEDCFYGTYIVKSNNSVDSTFGFNNQIGYDLIDCKNCNAVFFGGKSEKCDYCFFIENCIGCSNCFGCINLVNKSYYIYNQPVEKGYYHEFIRNNFNGSFNKIKEQSTIFHTFKNNFPVRNLRMINTENTIGDNINNVKNSYYCFDSDGIEGPIEESRFIDLATQINFNYDLTDATNTEKSYDSLSIRDTSFSLFNILVINSTNIIFSRNCFNCSNLFGCIGLRNKSYCILNKQYTKEEYEILVPKIIEPMMKTGEWGEFFPSNISPFGYNETVAQEYYPLTREDVLSLVISNESERSMHSHNIQSSTDSSFHSEGQTLPVIAGFDPTIHQDTGYSGHSSFEVNLRRMEAGVGHKYNPDDNHTKTFLHGTIFNWSDYETPFPKVEKIIPADKLPDNISQTPDDILNWAIECEITQKPFRIIKQELEFYRKHNLPIPRRHPDQRHKDRMNLRNPRKLFERSCDKCSKPIQTTYSPERPEKVYCESCYNNELY